MNFEEQGAELAELEALAQRLGMSLTAFERIAIDVTEEAQNSSVTRCAAQTLPRSGDGSSRQERESLARRGSGGLFRRSSC